MNDAASELRRHVAERALEEACPLCKAVPGQVCKARTGAARLPHSRRMELAFRKHVRWSPAPSPAPPAPPQSAPALPAPLG